MHCRTCGAEVAENAEICLKCGVKPFTGVRFCQNCGAETIATQEICVKCGVRLRRGPVLRGMNSDFSFLDPYYQDEFGRIMESNEGYKGRWNWAAFFFGPIWALTKGVWLPPLIVLLLCWTIVVPVCYWFIFGARGNYMYYCAHVKNKQIPV